MALMTNAFTTFDVVGDREDLSNVIYMISPTDVPFLSNAGRGKAKNTLFEWQTDSLAAVDTSNAQLEGDDNYDADAVDPTVRVANYQQISRKTLAISNTEEAIDKAGRKSEWSYQISKRGSELKRDMESILIGINQAAAAGNATTERTTASLSSWIRTNTDFNASTVGADPVAPNPTPGTARVDDGATREFTEAIFKSLVHEAWVAGANIGSTSLMVSGSMKQHVSAEFVGIATLQKNVGRKAATVVGAVDVYVTDFGEITIIPNRFMRTRDAFLIDWSFVEVAYLRPFRAEALAKTGDARKGHLIVEYGLKVKNEAALAGAYDLAIA